MIWLLPLGVAVGYAVALLQARRFWRRYDFCPTCERFLRPALPHDIEAEA